MRLCCRPASIWCVLDTICHKLGVQSTWLCDRHDLEITRDWIHCGDEDCFDDHG